MAKWIDWLFYISITLFFLWALGKAFGLIHSPVWVDMLPYFAGGGGLLAIFFKAGATYTKLGNIDDDCKQLKTKADNLTEKLSVLDNRVVRLEENISVREPFIKKLINGQMNLRDVLSRNRGGK